MSEEDRLRQQSIQHAMQAGLAQAPLLGNREMTPLDHIREEAGRTNQKTGSILARLHTLVDRLQGPTPQSDGMGKDAPRQGVIDDIRSSQDETLQLLEMIELQVGELERLL